MKGKEYPPNQPSLRISAPRRPTTLNRHWFAARSTSRPIILLSLNWIAFYGFSGSLENETHMIDLLFPVRWLLHHGLYVSRLSIRFIRLITMYECTYYEIVWIIASIRLQTIYTTQPRKFVSQSRKALRESGLKQSFTFSQVPNCQLVLILAPI